jgi:hypothetical protein
MNPRLRWILQVAFAIFGLLRLLSIGARRGWLR